MKEKSALASLFGQREISSLKKHNDIENMLEDSFVAGQLIQKDLPLPPNVNSTIAIAMAGDGKTFATTHGDHTVKVFWTHSYKLHRAFVGHPRTPWTVKYHSRDSNILASGCLGCQVRIWDIEKHICQYLLILENSIISLSFHPFEDYLAIAGGPAIVVWKWNSSSSASIPNITFQQQSQIVQLSTQICHKRNIRAILFHPNGEYLLAAAPELPKLANDTLTYCSLYSIRMNNIVDTMTPIHLQHYAFLPQEILDLAQFPVVLPQIHLYSDGGIDISKDGEYLVTCAQLSLPPIPVTMVTPTLTTGKKKSSASGQQQQQQEEEDWRSVNELSCLSPLTDQNGVSMGAMASFPSNLTVSSNPMTYGGHQQQNGNGNGLQRMFAMHSYDGENTLVIPVTGSSFVMSPPPSTTTNPASRWPYPLPNTNNNNTAANINSTYPTYNTNYNHTNHIQPVHHMMNNNYNNINSNNNNMNNNNNNNSPNYLNSPAWSSPIPIPIPMPMPMPVPIIPSSSHRIQHIHPHQPPITMSNLPIHRPPFFPSDHNNNNNNSPHQQQQQQQGVLRYRHPGNTTTNTSSSSSSSMMDPNSAPFYPASITPPPTTPTIPSSYDPMTMYASPIPSQPRHPTSFFPDPTAAPYNTPPVTTTTNNNNNNSSNNNNYHNSGMMGNVTPPPPPLRPTRRTQPPPPLPSHPTQPQPQYQQQQQQQQRYHQQPPQPQIPAMPAVFRNTNITNTQQQAMMMKPFATFSPSPIPPSTTTNTTTTNTTASDEEEEEEDDEDDDDTCTKLIQSKAQQYPNLQHLSYFTMKLSSHAHRDFAFATLPSHSSSPIITTTNSSNTSSNRRSKNNMPYDNRHQLRAQISLNLSTEEFIPFQRQGWSHQNYLCIFRLENQLMTLPIIPSPVPVAPDDDNTADNNDNNTNSNILPTTAANTTTTITTREEIQCVPVLVNARMLRGKLMRAITSAKFSPTCRYVLLGYGVRDHGQVIDHGEMNTACELVHLQDATLPTRTIMCDQDDEVNIAQFHAFPGLGIVYGTKRGKIRSFMRSLG